MQIAVEDKTGALLALFNRHFHRLVIQRGIEFREGAIRDLVYAPFGSFPERFRACHLLRKWGRTRSSDYQNHHEARCALCSLRR
jgi:hypothetical protein